MQQYSKNPRKITDAQLEQLKSNIKELGDLSGIVHDLNTDEIISGNQRSKVININECEIEIVKKYDEPNEQGTIAFGFVIFENQRLNYRQVRWNEKQREKACITANALGGEFDYDILLENWDITELENWGIKDLENKIDRSNTLVQADDGEGNLLDYDVIHKQHEDYLKMKNEVKGVMSAYFESGLDFEYEIKEV